MTQHQTGQRFSLNYISHPELLPDSTRMRRRLGLLFFSQCKGSDLRDSLNKELGVGLSATGCASEYYWPKAMVAVELRDVLDTVTIVHNYLNEGFYFNPDDTAKFLREVQRIFQEERVRYYVDEKGGVHLAVDSAFEQTRISSVQALSSNRYEGVRTSLDEAYAALDQLPPDGKTALRQVFFSNESLFRLIFPKAHQLGKGEMQKHLKPAVDQKYSGQSPALHAAQKQLSQYIEWVSGAHFYRHEPGSEEPSQPPLEMAIHYVTSGTAWLRWLHNFDNGNNT